MILPPKTLAWRLLFWSGLFAWAVWTLRDTDPGDILVTIPQDLSPPAGRVAPAGEPPPVVDVEALQRALGGVTGCEARGTLTVRIGAAGLEAASFKGTGDAACLGRVVWGLEWPRGAQALEMSVPVP